MKRTNFAAINEIREMLGTTKKLTLESFIMPDEDASYTRREAQADERVAPQDNVEEFSKEGTSKVFEDLKYADYNEIPVDIETFLDDNNYLGYAWHDAEGKSKLYPF